MKNPTILKDELNLLRADKSAVLTELRKGSQDLKDVLVDIAEAESERTGVRSDILEETARLDDIRNRAVSVKGELLVVSQDLKNIRNAHDLTSVKNSQERKLHLGRIKELGTTEKETVEEIARLKHLFDNNSKVFNDSESVRLSKLRELDKLINANSSTLNELVEKLVKKQGEDKKMTKDRLRREDKLRLREKKSDAQETSLSKREEDLITMSKDMSIVYSRLKELYANVDPEVDLDKLILQAI